MHRCDKPLHSACVFTALIPAFICFCPNPACSRLIEVYQQPPESAEPAPAAGSSGDSTGSSADSVSAGGVRIQRAPSLADAEQEMKALTSVKGSETRVRDPGPKRDPVEVHCECGLRFCSACLLPVRQALVYASELTRVVCSRMTA